MSRLSVRQQLLGLLALALVIRLLTLGAYPLADFTEARYGEIARKMLETGQWITPQIDYGVPFWAKPPLSIWLTAISFKLFGVDEFAARLPAALLGVAVCVLIYILGTRQRGSEFALRASVILASSLLMLVSAGAVETDPTMLLGTTLSMVAFWLAFTTGVRAWGYLFFVGLAIGLLAKGPVAVVLTLAPIGVWSVVTGRVRQLWASLPWIVGSSLTAALVVPWYWAAEARTPGFLHYFLVGEHWQRYTVSGWKGDLYGAGHSRPRGMIWLYFLLATLPWSPWLIWRLSRRNETRPSLTSDNGWIIYLLSWSLAPAVFFTFSSNVLPTYVLPGLPAFALITAEIWHARESGQQRGKVVWLGVMTPLVIAAVVFVLGPRFGFESQKQMISDYQRLSASNNLHALTYINERPSSAEFYSRGQVRQQADDSTLRMAFANPEWRWFATERVTFDALPEDLRSQLQPVLTSQTKKYVLLKKKPDALPKVSTR